MILEKELLQTYKTKLSFVKSEERDEQVLMNLLARDLLKARADIAYLNQKMKAMEIFNDTTRTRITTMATVA